LQRLGNISNFKPFKIFLSISFSRKFPQNFKNLSFPSSKIPDFLLKFNGFIRQIA